DFFFFFSSRRRHTSFSRDWSSDVCSSDLSAAFESHGRSSSASGRLVEPLAALTILSLIRSHHLFGSSPVSPLALMATNLAFGTEIGRASCRERVQIVLVW